MKNPLKMWWITTDVALGWYTATRLWSWGVDRPGRGTWVHVGPLVVRFGK